MPYLIELDLRGRTVLVVGLGPVGHRKALAVAKEGARVIGVDPVAREIPGVEVLAEVYRPEHLRGAALAFAAAPPEVNLRVVADARAAGIWVNSASDPGSGDFSVPASWQDGPIGLAVSTSGASPALAATLRDRAAHAIGPAAAVLASVLIDLRAEAFAAIADPEARRRILAGWGHPSWLDLAAREGADAVREALRATLRDGEVVGGTSPDRE